MKLKLILFLHIHNQNRFRQFSCTENKDDQIGLTDYVNISSRATLHHGNSGGMPALSQFRLQDKFESDCLVRRDRTNGQKKRRESNETSIQRVSGSATTSGQRPVIKSKFTESFYPYM